ncbi:MAG: hypothetical protein WA431_07570 [Candidatus Cybelea sp.]
MIKFSSILPRGFGIFLVAWLVVAATALPGVAQQMRQQIADKIATTAANKFVTKINGESCSDFANTMSQMKQTSGSGSSSSGIAAKLKANQQARTEFVNIVGGPLLNKMIDCDMLPGGT